VDALEVVVGEVVEQDLEEEQEEAEGLEVELVAEPLVE